MEIIGYFRSGIYPQVTPDAMRASDLIPQRQNGTANHFIGNGGFLRRRLAVGAKRGMGIMLRFMTPGCGAIRPGHLGAHDNWMRGLDEGTYLIEAWRCDLATGIFSSAKIPPPCSASPLLPAVSSIWCALMTARIAQPCSTYSNRRPPRHPRSALPPWCARRHRKRRSLSASGGPCSIPQPARICCKASLPFRASA